MNKEMMCKKRNTLQRNLNYWNLITEFKILKFKRGQGISFVSLIALTNGLRKACGDEEVDKALSAFRHLEMVEIQTACQ